jgi:hypothetical protein
MLRETRANEILTTGARCAHTCVSGRLSILSVRGVWVHELVGLRFSKMRWLVLGPLTV